MSLRSGVFVGIVAVGLWAPAPIMSGARIVSAATSQVSDDVLKDRIDHRLQTDPAVRRYDITAKVDDAKVLLTGTVATNAEKAQAARLANVTGVAKVDNQVAVDPAVDQTLMQRAKAGMRRSGEAVTDTWITTKVKWFYLDDDLLKGSSISVETDKRVVTLSGTVTSAAARKRAVDLANDTDGVLKVIDHTVIAKF